ncbi:MAG: hypothetical protein LQ350_006547 [Teloschistes chrysophthalmus]|nr:MAG: hypothetical protein LQ350_006547 [Niorma chrysophthalma]
MSDEVAALEAELKEYKLQLETVQSGLQADPDNADLQNIKNDLEEVITLTSTAIAELKPASAPAPLKKPSPPPVKEKWSKENHPAYQAGYRKPVAPASPVEEPPAKTTFAVNDNVLAKWVSGDKAFYPARITSITGSSSKPVYIVTFKSYATTETLSAHDIKPTTNNNNDSKKRKADGTPAGTPSTPTAPTTNTNVISAAADINPALASQAKREPSKVSDGPTRPPKVPRKVKATRELEAGKSKWQEFSTKGKTAKFAKKDSMFRTPEGVNARVGFTGSGQEMRKDPGRSRHIYQPNADDDA